MELARNLKKMEKREEALREALVANTEEVERWQTYQRDNEQAIENLEKFSKRLIVDVMVPLGPKAFSPGCLIHTNEVLVSHFQGYFSKCSANIARKICEKRVKMAKDHLEKLKIEAELWSNKLEKPYQDGVLPSAEQHEIIEDYDEEQEKLWREEHKRRIREAKLHEKQMRNANMKTEGREPLENFEEIFDEAEQIEELNDELNNLELEDEIDKEELIRKLLSGEMKEPPSKTRVAHSALKSDEIDLKTNNLCEKPENKSPNLDKSLSGIVKKSDLNDDHIPATNNNYLVNPEIQSALEGEHGDEIEESDHSDDDCQVPEEAKLIEQQAQFLSGNDQIVFYHYQLQIIEQKILAAPITNPTEIEQKVHLFRIRERLEELLEEAGATVDGNELETNETQVLAENGLAESGQVKAKNEMENNNQLKNKRISFALEDRTLEFRKTETVAEMLPKPDILTTGREVIRLNEGPVMETSNSSVVTDNSPRDRKQNILDKVEKNLSYVAEQQSKQDFDLVNKIIDTTPHTLYIKFIHSEQKSSEFDYSDEIDADKSETKRCAGSFPIPGSPADLYRLFSQERDTNTHQSEAIFVNAYDGEDQVRVPVLKEKDRKTAYKDLRMEFSNPRSQSSSEESLTKPVMDTNGSAGESSKITKSILKNKNAVEVESHVVNSKNNKTNTNNKKIKNKRNQPIQKSINEDECMSAYEKVMKDVVEKPSAKPDPLPEGRYIDTFAPKKRISRFKQMRSGIET